MPDQPNVRIILPLPGLGQEHPPLVGRQRLVGGRVEQSRDGVVQSQGHVLEVAAVIANHPVLYNKVRFFSAYNRE